MLYAYKEMEESILEDIKFLDNSYHMYPDWTVLHWQSACENYGRNRGDNRKYSGFILDAKTVEGGERVEKQLEVEQVRPLSCPGPWRLTL